MRRTLMQTLTKKHIQEAIREMRDLFTERKITIKIYNAIFDWTNEVLHFY